MYFTITSVKLKGPFSFLKLAAISSRVEREFRTCEEFVQCKSTGRFTGHYVMSLWKTEAELRKFHTDALKQYRDVAYEIRTLTLAADKLPEWTTAKDMLERNGRVVD